MAETRPTGEQLRFVSSKTGSHILDDYLEAVEQGTKTLPDMIADLFDTSGVFRTDNFEFQYDTTNKKLQVRVGNFATATVGWIDITTFFKSTGVFSASTTYNNFDLVTISTKNVYIVNGLTAGTTFASEAAFIASSNSSLLIDTADARDWATKTTGQIDSTDYSAKAYATGGTGIDNAIGSAKDWAIKTSVVDGTNYSAKYWATSADVVAVAGKATEIGILGTAANVTSMSNLGTTVNVTNMGTVAGISANVTTVAGLNTEVVSLAAKSTEIGLLGTASAVSDLSTLGTTAIVADINTVATNITAVSTVATDIVKVIKVADDLLETISEIETVADDLNETTSEIDTVANNIANVNTVGTNISDVSTVATNITNVNNVGANITAINTVNTNINSVNNFGDTYSVSATAPTTNLDTGDLYFDTTTNTMKVYGSSGWQAAGSSVNGTSRRQSFTATANQTSFTVTGGFDSGFVDVYMDGVKLHTSDFTDSSGTSVVLTAGATVGQLIDIIAYGTFTLANLVVADITDVTATAAELNYTDGVTSNIQTQLNAKVDDTQILTNVPLNALFTDTVYTHPSGDGNLHVPVTSTTNNGKVLTAGSTAGALTWETPAINYTHPNHSGDVVSAADGATTIQVGAVDLAMLSATGTASGTTFLRGDNTWGTPTDTNTDTKWDGGTTGLTAATGRTSLGLGTAATLNVGILLNQIVQLDSNAKLPQVDGSQLTNLPASGGVIEAVASGALANGDKVILKADGTVEVVDPVVVSQSIPSGSTAVYNTGESNYNSVSYDPNNANKFVVVYQDGSNSDYGTAVIGTVTGTTIAFGSEYVFNSGSTQYTSVAFDPNTANKFVVTWNEPNTQRGKAIVGTVSGTTISYGSEAEFYSSEATDTFVAFDPSTAGRFVVACRVQSSYYGKAAVGTVTGTSISFGALVQYSATNSPYPSIAFDPNTAGKFMMVYKSVAAQRGKAKVGTISGTSISFGTEYEFNTGSASEHIEAAFDPNNANKFVVVYTDGGNSSYGTAVVASVSGTAISFGSEYVYNSATTEYSRISFDPNASGKFVVAYPDYGNSGYGTVSVGTITGTTIAFGSKQVVGSTYFGFPDVAFDLNASGKFVVVSKTSTSTGTAIMGQISASIPNLTADNYIGISDGAYANAATATIQVVGATDDAQSGLTTGSKHYVQTDGTLSTAPDSPSVYAGVALSATKLLIKG